MQDEINDVKEGLSAISGDQTASSPVEGAEASPAVKVDPDENLPFGKHPRWQEVLKERNEAKTQAEQRAQEIEKIKKDHELLQGHLYQNRQAIDWWKALSSDKAKFEAVQRVIAGEAQQQNKPDPYAEYDPLIAEKLRKLDALEQNYQQFMGQTQADKQEQQVTQNFNDLEAHFNGLCETSKITDESEQTVLASLAVVNLQAEMPGQDIRYANPQMLGQAFQKALPMLNAIKKAERSKLNVPVMPASGSKTGVAARTNGAGTAQERVAEMARELGGY